MSIRITKAAARRMGIALPKGKKPGRSKYGAVKTVVDNITFASKKEAARYGVLKVMLANGEICDLQLQPEFPLIINGVKCGKYLADFSFLAMGKRVIEDCKGMKTPVYRLKKKIVEALYNISILET